jgi:hypothetical protein
MFIKTPQWGKLPRGKRAGERVRSIGSTRKRRIARQGKAEL